MRKIFTLILLIISLLGFSQKRINIGSTKAEVKKIQGEPTSIESYENFEEEIWRYGESGIATVTFKKEKVKAFNNYNHILKIGDISKNNKSVESEKPQSKAELWKELEEKANNLTEEDKEDTRRSITGLYGGGRQGIKEFPKKYEEMAQAKGLNPYAMPDEYELEKMLQEYEREKYLKWGLIIIGVIGAIFLLFKFFKNKIQTT